MRLRERGNVWPVITVVSVALLVLILPLVIRHRQASGSMATVDAQVSIGDARNDPATSREPPAYRWPDSEVPRTAERLRDVTAVAIAASTYVVETTLAGRPALDAGQHAPAGQYVLDAGEITLAIARRQLVPADWLTNQPGVLRTAHGTLHIRCSPSTLTVEVISIPASRADGPAMLIRIPDGENTDVSPRYFESMQVDAILYPNPFAPIPEVISIGWRQRHFKPTHLPNALPTN